MNLLVFLVLILGSYDPDTLGLLRSLKLRIQEVFSGRDVYSFLLEDLEMYSCSVIGEEEMHTLLVENFDDRRSVMFFRGRYRLEWIEDAGSSEDLARFLERRLGKRVDVFPVSVMDKFRSLAEFSQLVFLIRDREETRGGEYVELAYLVIGCGASDKVWFFKRENVKLSTMAMELLDMYGVKMRPYTSKDELLEGAIRVVNYEYLKFRGGATFHINH